MTLKVLPYKGYSESARALQRGLAPNAVLKKQTTPMKGQKILLNWGHSSPAFSLSGVTLLNRPEAVALASNKLTALQRMKDRGVNVPDFTNDVNIAKQWIREEKIVFCRTMLRANSGRGIVIAKQESELVRAPLYVKYIRKEKEYRLHVFQGRVIDSVEKRRRRGFQEATDYNRYVRSYEQGWIFARDGISINQATRDVAIAAVNALGLDFGAVDIVMDRRGNPVVLEVNTAPGLQGTTLENYKNAVRTWVNSVGGIRAPIQTWRSRYLRRR